ncbi:MAG: 3-dehydroquinate synthase [Thermodesulfobacteriota bacterium]
MNDTREPALQTYRQAISVPFEYPVCFTRDLFHLDNSLLADTINRLEEDRRHRAAVYIDSGVAEAFPGLFADILNYFESRPNRLSLAAPPRIIPGGEPAKNGWRHVHTILEEVGRLHLDRQSYILGIGGGAVLDMVGFAAAIIHRGLRLIRVPTTTLAQNDAGIGVKNGINDRGQKNAIGVFAPPFAVLNDYRFLSTLSFDQWIGGVAEAFKVAVIKDAEFFDYLLDHAKGLRNRASGPMERAVHRCAELHLDHIRTHGDPFEFGSARPLDFGHWSAHKLESMSGYAIGHGQAVSVGICLDAYVAMRRGLISQGELDRILNGFSACGLTTWNELLERKKADGGLEVLDGIEEFREHLGGELTLTLPDGIGRKIEVHDMDPAAVEEGIAYLKSFVPEGGDG